MVLAMLVASQTGSFVGPAGAAPSRSGASETNALAHLYGQRSAARTDPSWAVEPTPHVSADYGGFSDVVCTSTVWCEAVGSKTSGNGTSFTLAENWDGSSWTTQSTPNQVDFDNQLNAVSCSSASSCSAVGSYTNGAGSTLTLALAWNGATWKLEPTPNPSASNTSTLAGVSCSAATSCIAVGDSFNSSGTDLTLAEAWNGTSWKIQSTPNPGGATGSSLAGLSCTTTTACTAVGNSINSSGEATFTLAEAWNGTSWKIQSTPKPAGASDAALSAVSCRTSILCTAVGDYKTSSGDDLALAEAWNGTTWSLESAVNPTGSSESFLSSISCSSATTCTAVGANYDSSFTTSLTIAEAWNGTTWKLQSTPNSSGADNSVLAAVSCRSPSACIAAGNYSPNGAGTASTLGEGWNGTKWSIEGAPASSTAELLSVSCSSASACTAAGWDASSSQADVALAERWNGTSWSVQPTPDPGEDSQLNGVSCSSATACMAVGQDLQRISYSYVTLAEEWNGTTWTITPTPNPSDADGRSVLYSVSCTSRNACTAVGYYFNGSGYFALVERWNGSSWSIQSSPNPSGAERAILYGVSCASATACVAVGYYANSSARTFTMAEVWNGTTWKVQTAVDPGSGADYGFYGVSCISTTSCTAVGSYYAKPGLEIPLAEVWNGTSWTVQATPDPSGATVTNLFEVSCDSTSACIAVGSYKTSSKPGLTLAEQWNGKVWAVDSTPNGAGSDNSILTGVSCNSSSACSAVGDYVTSSGATLTLAEGESGTFADSTPPSGGDNSGVQAIYKNIDDHNPLASVSCPSTTWCMAGGQGGTVVTYDNGIWGTPTKVFTVTGGDIDGVSCPTTTFCMAISYIGGYSIFSGGTWSKPSEKVSGWGVSCSTPSFCMVETGGFNDLWVWKAGAWSLSFNTENDPNGGAGQTAGPMSCLPNSTTDCMYVDNVDYYTAYSGSWISMRVIPKSTKDAAAVSCSPQPIAGVFEDGGVSPIGDQPECTVIDSVGNAYALHGSSWTAFGAIDSKASIPNLAGVSCVYARCTAVDQTGNVLYENNFAGPVADWTQPYALKAGAAATDVSCASLSFCMEVNAAGDAVAVDPSV